MPPVDQEELKVVAHLRSGKLVKGYLELPFEGGAIDLKHKAVPLPDRIAVRAESGGAVEIEVDELKALFFVKRFEGRKEYREVKFFTITPDIEGLWVKVKFYDNEVTEGVVHNSLSFITNPGFFLKPPDPLSNNEITYIIKSSLIEFRVLGVKSSY